MKDRAGEVPVFEIDNSKRIVDNIVNDLTNTFEKRFSQSDGVYIFKMSSSCEVLRYGYAKNEENDFFIIMQCKPDLNFYNNLYYLTYIVQMLYKIIKIKLFSPKNCANTQIWS